MYLTLAESTIPQAQLHGGNAAHYGQRTRAASSHHSQNKPLDVNNPLPDTKTPERNPRMRKPSTQRNSQRVPAWTSFTTTTGIDTKELTTLTNFRLLIHADHHLCAPHLRSETSIYHQKLLAQHRVPSTIVPPLAAIQHLYASLESSSHLAELSSTDWDAFIFWLSYHKDYRTLSQLHRTVMNDRDIGSKFATSSYTFLTEARLRTMQSERATIGPKPNSPPSPSLSSIVQNTIEWMETINIPRNHALYGMGLRNSVEEKNWMQGINIWKRMKAEQKQLSSPPVAMTAYTIECYVQIGNVAEATRLLESICESPVAVTQSRVSPESTMEGGHPADTAVGNSKVDQGVDAMDSRVEYSKRQRKSMQALKDLGQKTLVPSSSSSSTAASLDVTSPDNNLEWKTIAYPALIEAICVEDKDKDQDGASLASELALRLLKHGYALERSRFRLLIRHIGACSSSEGAEGFLKRWLELSKSVTRSQPLSAKPAEEGTDGIMSAIPTETKGSRKVKTKRTVESTSRALAEAGLQEIVKLAIAERDFERAQRIFQGMSLQRIPLSVEASGELIVGLTAEQDFQSATSVLEKCLQDNRVPSIETANKLLRGLVRGDRLDESVAVFRDLTENYGVNPNRETFRSLMNLTAAYGQLPMTQRILTTLKTLGVKQDGELYRDLMRCYVRCENLLGAIKVFENMDRDGVAHEIRHINVLLEGAVRQSVPSTIIGILEVMASQDITPNPETWNILLSGAFQGEDRILAQQLFLELSRCVVKGAPDTVDGSLRASRHPVTFQLLVNNFADRYGVEPALTLLRGAMDGGYPSRVSPGMFRELMEKSLNKGKGVVGYGFYQLMRRAEQEKNRKNKPLSRSPPASGKSIVKSLLSASQSSTSSFWKTTPLPSINSTSPSIKVPTLTDLCHRMMTRLAHEGQYEIGKEMATDLILSGAEMDQELVAHAIAFCAKTGELEAAFGLFTKMGKAYGVEPSRVMVEALVEAAHVHGLFSGSPPSSVSSAPWLPSRSSLTLTTGAVSGPRQGEVGAKWDEGMAQQWTKVLRTAMLQFGMENME
ncbi:hypothetical protein BGZ51_003389 [Haplosporangium sp. Z 767]|nr:hypothetical protein BGZ51_003389 [Haplosporangium sp. Z 767]